MNNYFYISLPLHENSNISFALFLKDLKRLQAGQRKFSVRKSVRRNFAKLTGKHMCQSLYFNKFAGLLQLFLKKDARAGVFL